MLKILRAMLMIGAAVAMGAVASAREPGVARAPVYPWPVLTQPTIVSSGSTLIFTGPTAVFVGPTLVWPGPIGRGCHWYFERLYC